MARPGCKPHKLRVATLVSALLITLSSCTNESDETAIRIHAGAPDGPYSALIDMLDLRADTLKSVARPLSTNGNTADGCNPFQPGCPLLSKFSFSTVCDSGGSKTNLLRLGMKELHTAGSGAYPDGTTTVVTTTTIAGEDPDDPITTITTTTTTAGVSTTSTASGSVDPCASQANDFALVQNYFVAGAAQTYCPFQVNKLGPDWLYFFEFRAQFPWVGPTNDLCESFFAEQMDGRYEKFDDLRVVLPLYNGLVQFVTKRNQAFPATKPVLKTLESLKGKKVYLSGVNIIYGAEVLNRYPNLHNADKKNTLHPEWYFDEEAIITPQNLDAALAGKSATLIDYIKDPQLGESQRGNRMLACDLVEAYVISGDIVEEKTVVEEGIAPEGCLIENMALQQIQIPEVIIDAMVQEHPYYQKLPPPAYWEDTAITAMPGLITYLVTTESADKSLVRQLTTALYEDWDSLMLLNRELSPIQENILKRPAPFHAGAEEALNNLDLLGQGFTGLTLMLVLAFFCAMVTVNHFWKTNKGYNRLGEKQQFGIRYLSLLEALDVIIIVVGWIWIFMVVVTLIRFWDAGIASIQNADDEISGLSFTRTLLWMFTFISSGYEDNVFPSSSLSRIVVSSFAIAGIAYPLYLIAKAWDRVRVQRLNRARGGEFRGLWRLVKDRILEAFPWTYRSKGTLLLCGWNDKAPGIVYTLTCPDSPYGGMVNIVADMDIEYPIEHFQFNKSRVRFYRGDSSHRMQLQRAEALRANSALILGDDAAGLGKSNTGVLTALAIERFRKEIAVFAEMSIAKVDRNFMQQHIDNILDPQLIARQVLTIGCFDNYVLDFVLDALSPDTHSEWYSFRVSELTAGLPKHMPTATIAELAATLQQYGIATVGTCQNAAQQSGTLFSPSFGKDLQLNPLKTLASLQQVLKPDDYVVCAAKSPASFNLGYKSRLIRRYRFGEPTPRRDFSENSASIIQTTRTSASVLIIGHENQANAIAKHMRDTISSITVSTAVIRTEVIATDQLNETALDEVISAKLGEREWSHILLLSSVPPCHSQEEHTRLATRADSDTILRASYIRATLSEMDKKPIIVAEVNRTYSRQLAHDAEVTTVVPSSLLIERILARLVSGGGKVSEMLCAMLSMNDDVYLRAFKLHEGHPLIGKSFASVFNTWFSDGRILGILPKSEGHGMVDQHRNSSDDFDWHFLMCPPRTEDDQNLLEGDVIVALAYTNQAAKHNGA